MTERVVTVAEVLDGHTSLDIQCLDRIYLNAYVAKLQTSAQVVAFLSGHLGYPFPSPALFRKLGEQFRTAVGNFAADNHIPWVRFGKHDVGGKLELMRPYLARQAATGRSGVAVIGVVQEFQRVWTAYERPGPTGAWQWWFTKTDRRVSCYYFYLWDIDSVRRLSRSAPTSRIRPRSGSTGTSGPNARPNGRGSATGSCPTGSPAPTTPPCCRPSATGSAPAPSGCSSNAGLPGYRCRSPTPTATPATGGRPPCARSRPPARSCSTSRGTPAASSKPWSPTTSTSADPTTSRSSSTARIRKDTKGTFRTAIDRRDNGGVVINAFYKHSRIKQYLKDGRAMRIETVINAPRDLGCNARLPNLDELETKARACNQRILDAQRVGQGCVLASPAFARIAHPSVTTDGRRTPALRFGDPRVMALTGALCQTLLAATGFTNKNLRALIAGLLASTYTPGQMTYDLRRLRLAGLIRRLPHTNRYTLTGDGIRIAIFYTKLYNKLLVPLTATDQPQAPPQLRHTLRTLDRHVDHYIHQTRLKPAA